MNQSKIFGSPEESQFYTTTLRQPYTLETFLNAKYFKKLLNEEEVKSVFQSSTDHLDFFRKTISYCLDREGKSVFAEKSPMHTLYFKELLTDFENAEFMLIKRNLCANVQSIAFTKWIPLSSDFLPDPIKNNKSVRYFFATLHLYKYWKMTNELEKHPACKLSIQYEDIILEKVNMKELLQKALGFEMEELYVSRPFSNAVSHFNYGLDKSRVEDYKNVMPVKVQNFINSVFNPESFLQNITGRIVRWFLFEPLLFINKLRRGK